MAKQIALRDVETAVKLYYAMLELENKDIRELFTVASQSTTLRLKKRARALMSEKGVEPFSPTAVNTTCAYEAWGLDIKDLERRLKRLTVLEREQHAAKEGEG